MERENKIKQHIRENWFKDHKAILTTYGDITVLDWRKPGTSSYYCRYVFDGYKMYISGDIGFAVFNLTWKAGVHTFNGISTGYFMEKMEAFSDDKYDFDTDEAVKQLEEWRDQIIENQEFDEENEDHMESKKELLDEFQELIDACASCSNENEWAYEYVNGEFHDFIEDHDNDYWEWIYHIGRVIPRRILGYIVGLQMASEQLKALEINITNEEVK